MSEEKTAYKHDASDRKLDQSAESANESGQGHDTQHSSSTGHETAAIRGQSAAADGEPSADANEKS
jgi:hypothetical protein